MTMRTVIADSPEDVPASWQSLAGNCVGNSEIGH